MLNCAICDDNMAIVEQTEEIMKSVFQETGSVCNILTYTDSRLLISDIMEHRPLDLLVVDIEMPHYSGITVAEEAKKAFPDCIVIFLTSHVKYAVDSYELQIFRYAQKKDIGVKLFKYIKDALTMLELQKGEVYTIIRNDASERIPYKSIQYVKRDGKYIVIRCIDNRELRVRKSMIVIRRELNMDEFITIDRGCIVNITQINRIDNTEVICKTGERLPVSRSNLKAARAKISSYWGGVL